jgi:hypothetical protein
MLPPGDIARASSTRARPADERQRHRVRAEQWPRLKRRRGWLAAVAFFVAAVVVTVVVLVLHPSNHLGAAEAPSTRLPQATFAQPTVPFTFTYPGRFALGNVTRGILWVAGISPLDVLDVRRVDGREYSTEGLSQVYGATLRRQAGVRVQDESTRTVDDAGAVLFDVTTTAGSVALHSRLVYFSHGGSTWQLECQSQQQNRASIDAACTQALDTLSLR